MTRSVTDSTRKVNLLTSVDWVTIVLFFALVILGWLNIYAAVYNDEYKSIFDISQKYGKQMLWIGASIVLILIIFFIDSNFFSFFAYLFYGFTLILLLAVLFFGKEVNGARAWFEIGGFRLQPGEFGKLAACLAMAKLLSTSNPVTQKAKTLFLVCLLLGIPSALVVMQNDTGTALVYAAFVLVLYREGWVSGNFLFFCLLIVALFIATLLSTQLALFLFLVITAVVIFGIIRRRLTEFFIVLSILLVITLIIYGINMLLAKPIPFHYVIASAALLSAITYFLINLSFKIPYANTLIVFLVLSIGFTFTVDYFFDHVLSDHQRTRITVLLGMENDLKGVGYNVNQSKIAIGSGGLLGKGFLQGTQTKYDFVPEQSTDFIFCTIGEEWGFLGASFVIGLFIALFLRIIFLAERQRALFSRIFGYSLAAIMFFHFIVNIGMTIGLAPVIGIPLPFFSYGGSSLWAFTILLFIFIRLDASRLELLA